MVDVDSIDDSSSLPIANVSSLFKDFLINASSSLHVADDNILDNGSSNPRVVDAPNNLTPLFSDDGDTLHDLHTPVAFPLDMTRPIPQ